MGARRGGRSMGGLSRADWLLVRPRDDLDLDRRHFGEGQDRVALPGIAGHALAVEADRFLERPARRLDRPALDLIDDAVGVDGLADVDGDDQAAHPYLGLTLDLRHDGAIGAGILVARKREPTPETFALRPAPAGPRRGRLEHRPGPRIAQIPEPQRQRVLAALRR